MQVATGRVCGRGARQSGGGFSPFPAAKAYDGPLPAGADGIEFSTNVKPSSMPVHPGGIVNWNIHNPGVVRAKALNGDDMICVPITVIRTNP